jgi:hypothetical protein
MNIDHHTINNLRTLANQCAGLEHHAGLEPANLLALLDAFEERDEYRNHLAAIAEMTGNGEDIGAAHEGVNALAEDLARYKRMFAAACETLGEIQQALGNEIVGIEPVLVKELVEDRDAAVERGDNFTNLWREVCSERDALAALFVKLQDAATDLIHASNEVEAGDAMELIAECSEEKARGILARHDWINQAEVLEEMAGKIHTINPADHLRRAAAIYRKQAEGHQ